MNNSKRYTQKPLLLLVPHYTASIKYFQKLLPHLTGKYRPFFLLIFARRSFPEMLAYAKKENLPFFAITPPIFHPLGRYLPFYKTLKNTRHYARKINEFLNREQPAKIIATNDQGFYMKYLMNEANRRNIWTAVLQWALTYNVQKISSAKIIPRWRQLRYRLLKPNYVAIRNWLLRLALGEKKPWLKGIIGGGTAKQFGVINEQAREFFIGQGIPKEKMAVVGYLDFYLAELTKKEIRNKDKKQKLAEKYGIDPAKKNIIFYSTPFNRKDIQILTDEEQYRLTESVIKTIREVCPIAGFDILFKPHPSEDIGQYQKLNRYGIKFMNPLVDNNELVNLSDLYIAGVSTTNFIPLAINKDAIFINPAKLRQVELGRMFFGIKKFVTDEKEFQRLLTDFKSGNLEKQCTSVEKIITPDSLSKILTWIN